MNAADKPDYSVSFRSNLMCGTVVIIDASLLGSSTKSSPKKRNYKNVVEMYVLYAKFLFHDAFS